MITKYIYMQKNIFENTFQYIIGSNFQKFNKIIKIININREISMQLYIKIFKFLWIGMEIIKPIEFPNKKNIIDSQDLCISYCSTQYFTRTTYLNINQLSIIWKINDMRSKSIRYYSKWKGSILCSFFRDLIG